MNAPFFRRNAHKTGLCVRMGILIVLLPNTGLSLSAEAQDQAPSATEKPAQAVTARDLAQLKQHRDIWPAQLTLKTPVRMTIVLNGKEVGSIVSPQGATVDLISVHDTTLEIGMVDARATVPPEDTDLWDHVTPPAQEASPSPTLTATVAPSPSMSPAPLPSIPAPTPTPAVPPLVSAANAPIAVAGKPLLLDYEVSPRDNFTKAAFRFWSPMYDQPIRGLIVLVPGLNGDGRGMLNAADWQVLARKYRLALVSCFMQGPDYHNAMRGTGDALLEALKNFAKQSSHDEVAFVPLLLYGESAGGQFDYDFAFWKPERVMVFTVNKGGYYVAGSPDTKMCSTPGLFFLGQKDSDLRIKAITGIWTEGRKRGALWALAPQPNSGHEFSKTAAVARIFFDAVLKKRLPDDASASGNESQMNPMEENQGWMGDLTTHEIHDGSTDTQFSRDAAWLPDESSANAWKQFVSGG